jgi:hypothetical protein
VKWRIQELDESSLPLSGIFQLSSVCTCKFRFVTCFCHLQLIAGLQSLEMKHT